MTLSDLIRQLRALSDDWREVIGQAIDEARRPHSDSDLARALRARLELVRRMPK